MYQAALIQWAYGGQHEGRAGIITSYKLAFQIQENILLQAPNLNAGLK
jgi:hypothetical protein